MLSVLMARRYCVLPDDAPRGQTAAFAPRSPASAPPRCVKPFFSRCAAGGGQRFAVLIHEPSRMMTIVPGLDQRSEKCTAYSGVIASALVSTVGPTPICFSMRGNLQVTGWLDTLLSQNATRPRFVCSGISMSLHTCLQRVSTRARARDRGCYRLGRLYRQQIASSAKAAFNPDTCGQLQIEVAAEPNGVGICPCLTCQRRTGSVFAPVAGFPLPYTVSGRSTSCVTCGWPPITASAPASIISRASARRGQDVDDDRCT
ncbi:hypothetical protein FHS02_002110 [Massilia umbonata]|uniref:CENP-V/GFA domain-containing protein n=1 Tax=Pseudoduganella umbonata TaxID=864828 RepID=A0A7W5EA05_9BURK|nr:hypothetical protein [Pseudoduganella umbonata]